MHLLLHLVQQLRLLLGRERHRHLRHRSRAQQYLTDTVALVGERALRALVLLQRGFQLGRQLRHLARPRRERHLVLLTQPAHLHCVRLLDRPLELRDGVVLLPLLRL